MSYNLIREKKNRLGYINKERKVIMSMDEMWNLFLSKVKSKNVSVVTLNSIFCDLRLHNYENGTVTIVVPNDDLFLQRLEKNYGEVIKDTFEDTVLKSKNPYLPVLEFLILILLSQGKLCILDNPSKAVHLFPFESM